MMRSKRKLLWQVLLRVLPVAATVLIAVWYGASTLLDIQVRQGLLEKFKREAQFGAETIGSRLDTVQAALHAFAENDLVLNGLVDVEDRESYIPVYFRSLKMPGATNAQISMTDYRGRIIAANKPKATLDDLTWLEPVMRGEEYIDIASDALAMAVPILYQGNPEGAIVLQFGREGVADRLSFASPTGIYSVIKDDTVLHTSNPAFSRASIGKDGDFDGKWISQRHPVPGYPGLTVVVGQHTALAFQTNRDVNEVMLAMIALALLVLGGGIAFTAYLATNPLSRFRDKIHAIASASDLDHQVEEAGSAEFNDLAFEFNTMLNRLRQTVVSNERLAEENNIRRATEIALRDSEQRHITIIQGLPQPIYICRSGDMVFANTAFRELFGERSAGEVFAEAEFTPDNGAQTDASGSDTFPMIPPENSILRAEFKYDKFDGDEPRWFENITRTIHWDGQAAIEGILIEITERKRIEKIKDEFVSVVSHELRTPLTAMIGALALASNGGMGEIPEKAGNMVKLARKNAERLVELVNDILDLDKIATGRMTINFERLSLIEIAKENLSEVMYFASRPEVTFVLETDIDSAWIKADRQRLGQILINLLSNAAKFSPSGSTVVLRITRQAQAARIAVIDNGPGIAPAMHEKIFTKFFQIDGSDARAVQGTGLGLSISQALAERHASRIFIESDLGRGANFYFDLPLLDSGASTGGDRVPPPIADVA